MLAKPVILKKKIKRARRKVTVEYQKNKV